MFLFHVIFFWNHFCLLPMFRSRTGFLRLDLCVLLFCVIVSGVK